PFSRPDSGIVIFRLVQKDHFTDASISFPRPGSTVTISANQFWQYTHSKQASKACARMRQRFIPDDRIGK
ncbi:hypothetical protein, partial [Akkermansia sp.]|uniref:hypothetical protein n=1 Tax=Akkermansia sp. TaxID=1872421 RepID=UPI003AF0718E